MLSGGESALGHDGERAADRLQRVQALRCTHQDQHVRALPRLWPPSLPVLGGSATRHRADARDYGPRAEDSCPLGPGASGDYGPQPCDHGGKRHRHLRKHSVAHGRRGLGLSHGAGGEGGLVSDPAARGYTAEQGLGVSGGEEELLGQGEGQEG